MRDRVRRQMAFFWCLYHLHGQPCASTICLPTKWYPLHASRMATTLSLQWPFHCYTFHRHAKVNGIFFEAFTIAIRAYTSAKHTLSTLFATEYLAITMTITMTILYLIIAVYNDSIVYMITSTYTYVFPVFSHIARQNSCTVTLQCTANESSAILSTCLRKSFARMQAAFVYLRGVSCGSGSNGSSHCLM